MPSRDVLIEMIKTQLDADSRDQDFIRDVFLSLAVTVPPKSRARIRDALGPLLARARLRGSSRGSISPLHNDLQKKYHSDDDDDDDDGVDLSLELENKIGVMSTLLVLGR